MQNHPQAILPKAALETSRHQLSEGARWLFLERLNQLGVRQDTFRIDRQTTTQLHRRSWSSIRRYLRELIQIGWIEPSRSKPDTFRVISRLMLRQYREGLRKG
jgi:hypothetical protein